MKGYLVGKGTCSGTCGKRGEDNHSNHSLYTGHERR